VVVVACLALAAATPPPSPGPKLTVWQQVQKRCRHLARERLKPYPWPVAPVHRPHPVRADFGDPRTVFTSATTGSFSFHNGIDISAWPGNPVYPVLSGVVVRVNPDIVVVNTPGGRRFQYFHLKPSVVVNELVVASQTVLGTVRERWNHVHLTELRDDCTVNPLTPYHLIPYHDTTVPTVRAILFQTPSREPLAPDALSGKIRILADAYDTPALPSPFPWGLLPVAPAHVAWSLETLGGLVIAHNTAADFRYGEPLRKDFCTVYAPGTEQNFAAVDGTFHYGKAGRYLFDLTPHLIDTSRLPEGRYRITVTAADTAGNRGTRSEVVDLRKGPTLGRAAPDTRCSRPARAITGAKR
jgi:hypothetical protein